jgi:hypothetical protein
MTQTITPESAKAAAKAYVELVGLVAEVIREAGEIPSGHVYATFSAVLDLNQYNQVLAILQDAKVITISNFLITWVGPAKGTQS